MRRDGRITVSLIAMSSLLMGYGAGANNIAAWLAGFALLGVLWLM